MQFLPIFFLSAASLAQAFSNEETGKIVGGSEVKPHSVPHQAALLVDNKYFCGGDIGIS